MTQYPQEILRVLQLAEAATMETDIPRELKPAVHLVIAEGWASLQAVAGVLPGNIPSAGEHPSRAKSMFANRPLVLPAPDENVGRFPLALLLKPAGELALARMQIATTEIADSADKPMRPGRKSTTEADQKIADEYYSGLEAKEWEGQADYLRQRHTKRWNENNGRAKAWLCALLKRVKSRTKTVKKLPRS